MESLAGAYEATTFTVRQGSTTENQLPAGASITVTLTAAGITTGRLFVPSGAEDGSDFDADLAGTWMLEGNLVTFAHVADTFIRDMPFTVDGGRLSGEATFGEATLRVVLERQ